MSAEQVEAVRKAADVVGSQAKLARALGVTPVTVGQWLKPEERTGRAVPPKQCVRIEQITNGQVSRRALRPGDWREIWPELDQDQQQELALVDRREADRSIAFPDRRVAAQGGV